MWVYHEFIGVSILFCSMLYSNNHFMSTMKLNEREIEIQSCINLVFESVCNLRQIIFNALMVLKIMSLLRFYRISCCFNAGTLNLQSMIYNFQTTINHKFTKQDSFSITFLYLFEFKESLVFALNKFYYQLIQIWFDITRNIFLARLIFILIIYIYIYIYFTYDKTGNLPWKHNHIQYYLGELNNIS